ncbi:MAG: ABC transporter substrate-binding protein [Alphaproteobacteria bacterium]|nr:ABC transporter substrate-binding protein [Alphaproteobacteria bacterium]
MRFTVSALVLAAATALAAPADAKTFRWANAGDVNSMDPYARNETFLLTFMHNVYEPLLQRDKNLKLEPALAIKWSQPSATVWRFELRPNVKWHDGSAFSADDVVFSLNRANGEGSNMRGHFVSVQEVKKVDDMTVDVVTKYPDPVMADKLMQIAIMSKAWAEKNNSLRSADLTKNEENFATRNAMGTGPFMLRSREPDVKTVLVPNPNWWGKPEHNLTQVEFSVISNPATRVAALLSGQIDMMYEVPPQDTARLSNSPGVKIHQVPEFRTIFLGFDQMRDELLSSNVKGKNPFKDRRVRQAFYQAIDAEAIKTRIMRGQATPTGLMIAPGVNGFVAELNNRYPVDIPGAKKLLADAGYPNGFEVEMDCPNDRYVNDEAICQAVVAMLSQIGVKVNLLAQTRARYFAKVLGPGYNTSFFMLGWTPGATYDVHNVFEQIMQTRGGGKGGFNLGNHSSKEFDELANKIEQETDKAKRDAMIVEAHKIHKENFGHIPLHQQAVVWAARDNIELTQLADNFFPLRYVRVK